MNDAERSALARRGERLTSIAFGISIVGALALAVVYWRGGQPQLEVDCAAAQGGCRSTRAEESLGGSSPQDEVHETHLRGFAGSHDLRVRGLAGAPVVLE